MNHPNLDHNVLISALIKLFLIISVVEVVTQFMIHMLEVVFQVQYELWECKCGLNESVCNSLQRWNHNECRSDCKELNGWGSCIDDYI